MSYLNRREVDIALNAMRERVERMAVTPDPEDALPHMVPDAELAQQVLQLIEIVQHLAEWSKR